MIIVTGTVMIRPEMREAAIERGLWMSRLTEQEPGCHAYRFYADLADPATFLVFEAWESDEALRAHFGTPHMAAFSRALSGLVANPPLVTRYEVIATGTL